MSADQDALPVAKPAPDLGRGIGTHTGKLLNARAQDAAVRAQLAAYPADLVSSGTVKIEKLNWGMPFNGALMGRATAEIDAGRIPAEPMLPPPSGNGKQVIVPLENWRDDGYVCVGPLISAGLTHEMWRRLEKSPATRSLSIQPNPAARVNHGEQMLAQYGRVRLLRRGLIELGAPGQVDGPCVEFSGRVTGANIGAGMIARAFPALTAIGGLVHTAERATGLDLEFAIGYSGGIDWRRPGYVTRRLKNGGLTNAIWMDELTATARFTLLLRARDPADNIDTGALVDHLYSLTRLAGGSIFEHDVAFLERGADAPDANFIVDDSAALHRLLGGDSDALAAAILAIAEPQTGKLPRTLNPVGWGLLGSAVKGNSRQGYPFFWAESLHGLVTQEQLSPRAWWRRVPADGFVRWMGAENAAV